MLLFPIKTSARSLILVAAAAIFLFSCQKTESVVTGGGNGGGGTVLPPTPPDLTTQVVSSVSGFVTDENDVAINNVTVQAGNVSVSTDKYGHFQIQNAVVIQNAAVVTVTRTGYFKSIKTYTAIAGKPAFFRIKMIPKTNVGSVNGGPGGAVTLANGMNISFPANSFINAANHVAYTGTVQVAANWIDPTGTDLNRIMPGDLRGLNTEGSLQLLASFGMAAVELTGSGGELLQIAAGKKAALSMPLPSALTSSAPATIPLWYFDEVKGLWKQEGTANKTGNSYTGEVSHFSFWNCDVPNGFVQFNCTIVTPTGQPVQNTRVKISAAGSPWYAAYGYTNADGFVNGPVPNNAQLVLEVFANSSCGTASYSHSFTTTNQGISLGNITVSTAASLATITGTVTNCNSTAVTNGYIVVQNGLLYNTYTLSSTGTYSFTQLICGGASNNITIVAADVSNAQESLAGNYSITAGTNTIPNISACVVHEQYLNFTINGVPYSYSTPADLFQPQAVGGGSSFYWYFVNNVIELSFTRAGIAQGSTQNLYRFFCPQIPYSPTFNTVNPITIAITECGPVDFFISGNFSGTIIGPAPANNLYDITCNFRVKRVY